MAPRTKRPAVSRVAELYQHTQQTPMRPEVGTQAQFKKRKAPKTYRYDSSLDPALSWDDNASRAMGEWLLSLIYCIKTYFVISLRGLCSTPSIAYLSKQPFYLLARKL